MVDYFYSTVMAHTILWSVCEHMLSINASFIHWIYLKLPQLLLQHGLMILLIFQDPSYIIALLLSNAPENLADYKEQLTQSRFIQENRCFFNTFFQKSFM